MPVQEAIPYSEAIGNGVSKSFSLGFPCGKKEYLIVKVNDVRIDGSAWALSNNTVTFNTAPILNAFIQFKRETKIERTTDYATYNDSLRGPVLNQDFDKIYEILQENKADTTQYEPDYAYSVAKANEAYRIAQEAYGLAELTEIEHGGTGARTAEQALENLNAYSKEEVDALVATGGAGNVVPISIGGTGATTKEQARENLDVPSIGDVTTALEVLQTPNATETTAGKAKIATTAIAQAGVNNTDIITAKKLRDALNAEGEAPIHACRGLLLFNGVDGATILSSSNIATLTRLDYARYRVVFIKPMPSANYIVVGSATDPDIGGTDGYVVSLQSTRTTVKGFEFHTGWAESLGESPRVCIAIFGG